MALVKYLIVPLMLLMMNAQAQEAFKYSYEADRVFSRGLDFFRNGRYAEAVEAFDKTSLIQPLHQRTTASLVMKGKALIQLEDFLEASRTLRGFLAQYSWSSYASDAEYMMGLTQARIRRYDEAMSYLLSAWRKSVAADSGRLQHNITAAIEENAEKHIPVPGLKSFIAQSMESRERQLLWLKIAEKESAAGNVAAASVAIDSLEKHYPGHPYAVRIAAISSSVSERSRIKLGALLPLMKNSEPSAAKQIGNDVYDGVLFAVEEYQSDPEARVKVALETKDTERDPAIAERVAGELCEDREVIGIIGPVFSQTTVAAAKITNRARIPLVTPTANSNGIAASGVYTFQANPDYENRGKALARFAVEKKQFSTFAVLSPSDTHGKLMAEGFVAEAIRLGGKVVISEWYSNGSTDFTTQLQNIRRAAEKNAAEPMISFRGRLNQSDLVKLTQLGVPRKRLDSLVNRSAVVPAVFLLGPRGRALVDSLEITAFSYARNTVDSLDIAVTGIDAIYCPITTSSEIGLVSSQIVYFNIQAQLLGSGEWNSFADLDANKRYCEGVIFEADGYPDEHSAGFETFMRNFQQRFSKQPGKNTLYGYDAARMMLGLIREGASNRESLTRALSELQMYEGLHAKISLADRRVNSWLKILQYNADVVHQIDEINVSVPPVK